MGCASVSPALPAHSPAAAGAAAASGSTGDSDGAQAGTDPGLGISEAVPSLREGEGGSGGLARTGGMRIVRDGVGQGSGIGGGWLPPSPTRSPFTVGYGRRAAVLGRCHAPSLSGGVRQDGCTVAVGYVCVFVLRLPCYCCKSLCKLNAPDTILASAPGWRLAQSSKVPQT